MKTPLTVVPPIALAIVAPVLAPAWLFVPAIAFAVFVVFVHVLVRGFGLAFGLVLRALLWIAATGIIALAMYAIARAPVHSLLAWLMIGSALLALLWPPHTEPRLSDPRAARTG